MLTFGSGFGRFDGTTRRRARARGLRSLEWSVLALFGLAAPAWGALGDHQWSRGVTGTVGGDADLSGAGHTGWAGTFFGTVDFGGGPLVGGNGDTGDVFIARYSPSGGYQWAHQFTPIGSSGGVFNVRTALDPAGNHYVTGDLNNVDLDLGGGLLEGSQSFVAKFDASGTHVWSFEIGDAVLEDLAATDDHLVAVGRLDSGATADFGGGPISSAGGTDAVIVRWTTGGAHDWSAGYGDAQNQRATSVSLTPAGAIRVAGTLDGSIDFGGGSVTASSGSELFVAGLGGDGGHLFSRALAGNFSAFSRVRVAAGNGNRTVLACDYTATCNLGGATFSSMGSNDIALASYSGAGSHEWSATYGTTGIEFINDVVVADSTGVAIVLQAGANVDLGGGTLPTTSSFFNDCLAVYDDAGAHKYSATYGSGSTLRVHRDATGDLYVQGGEGNYDGVDFGGGGLPGNTRLAMARFEGEGGGGSTSVAESGRPAVAGLSVHPNPVRGGARVSYSIAAAAEVSVELFDVRGRRVQRILPGLPQSAGTHGVEWRAPAAAGVYFVRVRAGRDSQTRKVTVQH